MGYAFFLVIGMRGQKDGSNHREVALEQAPAPSTEECVRWTFDLWEHIWEAVRGQLGSRVNVRRVLVGLCSKAMGSLQALALLSAHGMVSDGRVIVRSIFEALVNAAYIAREPRSRVGLYWCHAWVLLWRFLGIVKKHPLTESGEERVSQGARGRVRRNFNRVKSKYPNWQRWAGKDKDLRKMAKDVGLEATYEEVYFLASLEAHATAASEVRYGVTRSYPSPEEVEHGSEAVLQTGCRLCLGLLHTLDRKGGLGMSQEVNDLECALLMAARDTGGVTPLT